MFLHTLKDFENAKIEIHKTEYISLKFGNSKHQYVSKICTKFHIKIMSNKRVTLKAYQITIPLDSKVAINSPIRDMSGDKGG